MATIDRRMEPPLYLLVAMAYALVGAALGAVYCSAGRLREEPGFHLVTLFVILLAAQVAVLGSTNPSQERIEFEFMHAGTRFFVFVGASLLYVPTIVFLILHYWELLVDRILHPGSRKAPPRGPRTEREYWEQIQIHLETLTADPTNPLAHERLGDLYANMGFLDSAVFEYRKAAEWCHRGYAQGNLLYKAAHVLVEKKKDVPAALGLLRRIVRLYPKSCFAAYSRRIINRYEAHHQR